MKGGFITALYVINWGGFKVLSTYVGPWQTADRTDIYFLCYPPSFRSGMHSCCLYWKSGILIVKAKHMLQKTVPVCVSWPRAKYTTGLFAGKNLTCIAEGLKLLVYFFFLPPRVMRFLPILQSFKVPAVLKVLSLFLSLPLCRDDHGFSPLHWACREGRSNVVDMLIMRGARINVMNRGDDTPLHLASSHGHREIVGKVRLSVNTVSCRQKVPSWFLWSSRL